MYTRNKPSKNQPQVRAKVGQKKPQTEMVFKHTQRTRETKIKRRSSE